MSLNNLGSKHGLLMKFSQFIYYSRKYFIKKFNKNCDLKTGSVPFVFAKNLAQLLLANKILKQTTCIRYVIAKLLQLSKSARRPSQIPFYRGFFENQKGLELVFRSHFSQNFLINIFLLYYYINWPNFFTRLCLCPKLFSKMSFVVHALVFYEIMTFEYMKVKI